jgi:SAM-dependent methyltransferase
MSKVKLSAFSDFLLDPNQSETTHIKNIKTISANFTTNRSEIKNYVLDESLASSYTLFYLPTNIPKFEFVFSKLPEMIQTKILNQHFIDIGCGPGTFSYALKLLSHKAEVTCVDTSTIMLKQAEQILCNTFSEDHFSFVRKFQEVKKDSTLFFGNSINEMGIQNAIDLVNVIDPEIVIFIEPGTSELFNELKKFRELMISDYDIIYPCPSNAKCPNDWCHQVLRTSHDLEVERLSQLVRLDRKIMPMTSHVYVRKNKHANQQNSVLIRFVNETKFSFVYEVCEKSGDENSNSKIEIMRRDLSKEKEKYFKNANVGDLISFKKDKLVGDTWRVHVD